MEQSSVYVGKWEYAKTGEKIKKIKTVVLIAFVPYLEIPIQNMHF